MKRTIAFAVGIGTALALVFWFCVEASDAVFQTRLLPRVMPLIHLQEVGLNIVARFFQCQKEGFNTGCEAYKTFPTLLVSNSPTYSIALLPVVHFWRRRPEARCLSDS